MSTEDDIELFRLIEGEGGVFRAIEVDTRLWKDVHEATNGYGWRNFIRRDDGLGVRSISSRVGGGEGTRSAE